MQVIIAFLFFGVQFAHSRLERDPSVPCYDEKGRPQRCQPPFVNAAFGRVVEATNTCGVRRVTEYCMQTGVTGDLRQCAKCDDSHPDTRHPPEFLSDFNNNTTKFTSWQSETMLEGIQYPNVVNLTLHLKKSFDITYVNLRFQSPRPESFAIYKRTTEDGPWIPFQFYSASCDKTYNLPRRGQILREDQAICTNEFSDISPLTGGTVAFSTLEGRPNMFDFLHSPKLQEWVTATDIRIVLTRMNTFGDEVFGDPQVLKSYFYAISDLSVGARCKCNGHARECRSVRGQDLEERLECVCEHYTAGVDCEKCLPFYNDRPWGRATETNVNECVACDCNGLSETCEFDPELFRLTGSGGRCTNCRDNTDGVHCELCEANYYRRENQCISCGCHPTGSRHSQCDSNGQCPCKPGVGGMRCDRCLPNFYDYGENGCTPCACFPAGSLNNEPRCDSRTGHCMCKQNVDGRQCDKCKPGFFGLSERDPFGCMSCFCYGHSSECTSASDYFAYNITSTFDTGNQRWTGVTRSNREVETQYNGITQNLGVSSDSREAVYFSAPARYLGDQRFSYNQFLTFDLRLGDDTYTASAVDIIFEGSEKSVSTHIFAQGNPYPGSTVKSYAFRLHENSIYSFTPPNLKSTDFIAILSNLTAIKIRATYMPKGVGFIDNIQLGSARQSFQGGSEATWVESCTCPQGYIGQFCESCIQGYKREPANGGTFARCVPCECNGHSDSCDANTGRCICQHNTEGNNCENCARGYYGDATKGTPGDCTPCPCPNGGPCIQIMNGDVVCTECDEGYGGNLCELCLDGYFGDPQGLVTGRRSDCRKCTCNGNIDPNAVNNCNTTTGECLKCIRNTGGFYCDQCLPDFYNNTYGLCTACNCNPSGTVSQPGTSGCNQKTGQCLCLPKVVGQQCERCEIGYWNIATGQGCSPCQCDIVGSLNYTCDETYGLCQCKPGVSGRTCNQCDKNYYGFSFSGCTECMCDPIGSLDQQCDANGNCPCKTNVDGRRCDRCMENKYDLSAGCLDCLQCYNLVQKQVSTHRANLRDLKLLIEQTSNNPGLFNDSQFFARLSEVNSSITNLLQEAKGLSVGDGAVGKELEALKLALSDVLNKCGEIGRNIATASKATQDSEIDIEQAEKAIERADLALKNAEKFIAVEGQAALDRAVDALGKFGTSSQQMTEIAKRASNKAKEQTLEAQMIDNLSNHALATSKEAYRLANESLNMPIQTNQEIEKLKRAYDDVSLVYQTTKLAANTTLVGAIKAKDDVFSVFNLAQNLQQSLDFDMWKQEADKVIAKANMVKADSKMLLEKNKDLMDRVNNQSNIVNDLLKQGNDLNQVVAEYLAEVDGAKAMAVKAMKWAEDTLKEANETLQTLEEFNKLIENKEAAENALKQVDAIKAKMDDSNRMTNEAKDTLLQVEQDVDNAWKTVQSANSTIHEAQQKAQNLKKKTGETKTKSNELNKMAEELSVQQQSANDKLDELEMQVKEDQTQANNALKESDEVNQKAEDALKQISTAHDLILSINRQLGEIGEIDINQLNYLEKLLEEAEKKFNESNIDVEMTRLLQKTEILDNQAKQYDLNIAELRKAVENVGEISASLPDGCFKNIALETGV
ncbi:laminin subunit gamma-1-like [Biomphalaria glabrata]|uniref:Laminin subunit gamma-1-like n=2 Tax=Biomphalaria glabrata TaxID=6526 RepID=A0A9W3B949_BIOGL|nr:laminin subunit gamma-1-like [Biomphalaria glabrata]